MAPGERTLFRVIFMNQGKSYEILAREVVQSDLFGFLEIRDLVFGEKSQVLVDPTEDGLRKEFEDTKRIILPLHSIVRIDELDRQSRARARVVSLPGGAASTAGNGAHLYGIPSTDKE
ncbi:MAG: hypothetical protein CMN76_17450 [Spirochaetaceae bacterium]|nr:hypothetical protein [Spirochaetaceae bacterium]